MPDEGEIPAVVTFAQIAKHLDIGLTRVRDFVRDGTFVRTKPGRLDFNKSVHGYVARLRQEAAGRSTGELSEERARLASEQADSHAMKNAVMRGELVSVEDVRRCWGEIFRNWRTAWLVWPAQLHQRMPHLDMTDLAAIQRGVREQLRDFANDERRGAELRAAEPADPAAGAEAERLDRGEPAAAE